MAQIFTELGPWAWLAFGVVLLALEIFAPGAFMIWIGAAALAVGLLSVMLWNAPFWTWHVQVVLFLALSVVSVMLGRHFMGTKSKSNDQPLLNRRGQQMVGRLATLTEPIKDGRGRIQLGDTLWLVTGPDLPVGTQVKVIGASDTELDLIVEAL